MKLPFTLPIILLAALSFASMTAVAANQNDTAATASTTTNIMNPAYPTVQNNPSNAQHTDGTIIEKLIVVDKNEIAASHLAMKRHVHPSVRKFAQFMLKEHGQNLKETMRISHLLGIRPVKSDASINMDKQGKEQASELNNLQGKEFEKTYIDDMVKGHQDALDMLNDDMKMAHNPKFKKHLKVTARHVKYHLRKAKAIQAKFNY